MRGPGGGVGGRWCVTRRAYPGSCFPPQQFLDDPKYSSDEDLPSKLEAFKSEGKTIGVEKGVRRVGFPQEESRWQKRS